MDKNFFSRIEKKSCKDEGPSYITQKRVWGSSVVLDANARIHFINGEPSAHFHRNRTEDYILYSGKIEVYRGTFYEHDLEKTLARLQGVVLSPGDRVVIPPLTVHIPINLHSAGSVFLEISHGPYEEGDIERIYDMNGRDPKLATKWSKLGYKRGTNAKDLIQIIKNKLYDKK